MSGVYGVGCLGVTERAVKGAVQLGPKPRDVASRSSR